MLSFRRRHSLIGALVLLTLLTNAFVAYWNIARLVRNERLVSQTLTAEAQIERVASLAKDLESSQRGFLLFGDEESLKQFREASDHLQSTLSSLESTGTDKQQKAALPLLRGAVEKRLASGRYAIALRRSIGLERAVGTLHVQTYRSQMDDIRRLVDQMREREDELLSQRTGESSDSAADAFRTFWIATGANLAFVALISWFLLQAARGNRALEQAISDLKRAETLRDNLSQMLVHDLRTPLTTLLGPLQLLESQTLGPLDPIQKEVVSMSAQSGERLLGMVNGLLDISKLEAGELKLRRTQFPVSEVFENARRHAKRDGDTSTAPILCEPTTLQMLADGDIIERVLINLLGNALKFTPCDGRVTLRATSVPAPIALTNAAPAKSAIRVEVEDTGEGIPPDHLERIFDKFGQVETRENGHKASTGLGLTFCKLAIEAHGGTIGVRSQVGQGSTFWFELPV